VRQDRQGEDGGPGGRDEISLHKSLLEHSPGSLNRM
jgi:hypothetical protein